ncbi:DinB family protein [Rudaeicoccus suwonensis]|uniref:DinB family protein n=1 Tax=Rudaeicoccus suwonensis TaxID=657409 RepID=A0A561E3R0_9MICO|nr:DinB family protein [Rudaeicoccus suwonensis]TWE10252.1 DinB family protein [Rudaeicoccus suwonensis]
MTESSEPRTFVDESLVKARFIRSNLSGVVMRGVILQDAELDSPWLFEDGASLVVNGIDVVPLIDAVLNERYPGRAARTARDPAGLRSAWSALERAWGAMLDRVADMPPGTVDVSVDDEWSFAQTLRHLVLATDVWLGQTILQRDQALHPIGMPFAEYEQDGYDMSIFVTEPPSYDTVLQVRAERVAMVRDFLADVSAEQLKETRESPWDPDYSETVLSCLHTILGEEWEHLRYAERDLDRIAANV